MRKSKTSIIGDTSAFFSLGIKADRNNVLANNIIKEIVNTDCSIIVPGEVLTELINILGKKVNHSVASIAVQAILTDKRFTIVETTEGIRKQASEKFKKQPESVSFTDCLVMAFGDEFETKEIFGFDEAFAKNGYKRVGIER